jgi:hypothetical protein
MKNTPVKKKKEDKWIFFDLFEINRNFYFPIILKDFLKI